MLEPRPYAFAKRRAIRRHRRCAW